VAEEKAAAAASPEVAGGKAQKPTLFIILALVNMLVVVGVGAMMYLGKKKESAEPKIENVVKGEHEAQEHDAKTEEENTFIRHNIELETFVVNMAGSRGRRLARVSIELELDNDKVREEIEARKAQIRDLIIIIISGKTVEAVSSKEGKNALRDEIKDTVSGFLTKGKIKKVYFTEFIYN
jgi:flagellar FliL protein